MGRTRFFQSSGWPLLAISAALALFGAAPSGATAANTQAPTEQTVVRGAHRLHSLPAGVQAGIDYYPVQSSIAASGSGNVHYNGGRVLTTPSIYVVYWGVDWQ